ncbi:hypothetical protein AALP_AA1G251300 [Arabis alpina]|uniref:Reverse transcriptase domain-containing protein n=1 Tax=Arabis alpina TaxID=50452 RepID=A0A087HQI8_ARAAL|nr:hypothetical protein AALP_AA1G251300 [Arabis alpina]
MMSVAKLVADWSEADSGVTAKRSGDVDKGKRVSFANKLGPSNPSGYKHPTGPQASRPTTNPDPTRAVNTVRGEPPNPSTHNRVKPPYRRLTPAEIAWRKAENLCFRCDEKGHARPQCPYGELKLMVVLENGEEREWDEDQDPVEDPDVHTIAGVAALSLHSMVGISSPQTIKLRGTIGTTEVMVLIDSGATHNFIAARLGVCKDVELCFQGYSVVTEFLPLELGSADVILGIQWLASVGDMHCNWKQQRLSFEVDNREVCLQGDPSVCCAMVSMKGLWKALQHQGEGFIVEYGGLQSSGEPDQPPSVLSSILTDFHQVFAEPQGLPPSRGREHAIVLATETAPVSVRPFRYPQVQRAEIERQVTAMLAAGIIKESTSPFSSPVLLVKKKDGSWRFCVDYRALNRATVADSYPIPMIDQLLNELHGSVIFSKLDLRAGYHQIRVKAEDVPKTAFRTHDGHYEFLVMPFSLTNAPATFQSLMNDLFQQHLRRFVLVFFDDILVYSKSLAEHQQHLRIVFQVLASNELYVNRKKCQFGRSEVEYLGHVISARGVAADPAKLQAMAMETLLSH